MDNPNEDEGIASPDDDRRKLIPEWSVAADDQIVILGAAFVALMFLLFGWNQWRGDDTDTPLDDIAATVASADGDQVAGPVIAAPAASAEVGDPEPIVDETASIDGLSADVNAAVSGFGDITGSADGDVALLEGFVGTADDSIDAETAALGVAGIETVDNRLVVLEPAVTTALTQNGVADAAVSMDGTVATVRGIVPDLDARDGALAAAAGVAGVTDVIDELTVEAPDYSPAVAAAVGGINGVTGSADGDTAILEGFVGTAAESEEAETAAAAVEGITSVDNRLVILEDSVLAALNGEGVTGGEVTMNGTEATVRGIVPSEDARAAALAAAAAVPGVTGVVDELEVVVPVENQINEILELDPIQFATNSATILDASFPTLDAAADLLSGATDSFEIQGYTDVQGGEEANLALSQARADAVLQYLADNGIDGTNITAVGYGETEQFGEGDSPEALAANRRVRFERE